MKLSVKQVVIMVAAFLLTVGVLKAGQWVYTDSAVRTPLMQTVKTVPGVSRAQLAPDNAIEIWLKNGADLMSTYDGVQTQAAAALGKPPKAVKVMGNPTPAMSRLAQSLRFVIAQGESTGQYVAMHNAIDRQAHTAHMTAATEMGDFTVYLTLTQGKHHLYQVIPITLSGGANHG